MGAWEIPVKSCYKALVMTRLAFLIILLTAASGGAFTLKDTGCKPANNSCEFYRCVESETACGPKGYPLNFGERLCERYRAEEPKSSSSLQVWYPKVRKCLQVALKQAGEIRDCGDLSKKAFASHVGCYVGTGFCDLSFGDKFAIAATTGVDLLNPDAQAMVGKVQEICKSLRN